METKTRKEEERILWHPAFIEALQMELEEYHDVLEFHPEFQLTSGPLRIDCVVVRKTKNVEIKKNIAAIFRDWNLLEYKSPGDTLTVANFYKVYAYACLYVSFEKVPVTGVTVTFIGNRFSKKLLNHLKNERGYTVAETGNGIYNVRGDIFPIQIINSRKLSEEENLWLKGLGGGLNYSVFRKISAELSLQGDMARITTYLHAIMRANLTALKEEIKMDYIAKLDQVFIETGLTAKWEARGREEGRKERDAEIASKDAEIARLREQLQKKKAK